MVSHTECMFFISYFLFLTFSGTVLLFLRSIGFDVHVYLGRKYMLMISLYDRLFYVYDSDMSEMMKNSVCINALYIIIFKAINY